MSQSRCQYSGCDDRATLHLVRVEQRQVAEAISMCDDHGRMRVREYYDSTSIGRGTPLSIGSAPVFDIDFLFWDELQGEPNGLGHFELIEVGGQRRFGMRVDSFAWLTLNSELHRYQLPRPPTHRAMAALLAGLDARLQHVEIDKMLPADQYVYEAKLHVEYANRKVIVDVRPSDAIVLAVICDVPIAISNQVLAGFTET